MSKGFSHSPLADINLIRANLRDRYHSGFPVLKELIQNADDAKATRIDVGYCRGIAGTDHSLLDGPALFIANDGRFRSQDAKAIRQMGLSDRASEAATIGKFGLGLKSIFHLCEAYFYLSSGQVDETNNLDRFPRNDVLNPWSSDDPDEAIHPEWDGFSATARERLIQYLQPVISYTPWFCLWIPLRRRGQLGRYEPIVPAFPGDEPTAAFLEEMVVRPEVINLLPMLAHVRAIRIWLPRGAQQQAEPALHFSLNGQGRQWIPNGERDIGDGRLSGDVVALTPDAQRRQAVDQHARFAGLERLANLDSLRHLKTLPAWPSLTTADPETKGPRAAPEIAFPHCAAYFVRHTHAERPALSIRRSVFLPVGDPPKPVPIPDEDAGRWDYHLILHGYFFLDSGRSRIEIAPLDAVQEKVDEQGIRLQWNSILYEEGVLPLVLPALDQFVTSVKPERRDIERLTAALQASSFFRQCQRQICSRRQWLARYPTAQWELHAASQPVLDLPAPPDTAKDRPLEVFPALQQICREHLVMLAGRPRLRAMDAADPWPDAVLEQLLDLPVAEVFSDEGRLRYLLEFLTELPQDVRASPQMLRRLGNLARRAFRDVPVRRLRSHRNLVQRFLALIPGKDRVAMGVAPTAENDLAVERLLRLDLSLTLVPRDLDPDLPQASTGVLPIGDAETILRSLARPDGGDASVERRLRVALALQVVNAVGNQKAELLRRCGTLRLFTGDDVSTEAEADLSANELDACRRAGALFVRTPAPGSRDLAAAFQRALAGARVLVIESEVKAAVLDQEVGACTVDACVRSLLSGAELAGGAARVALLERFTADPTVAQTSHGRTAVRLLLHGRPDQVADQGPLLIQGTAEGRGAWSKLTRAVLRASGEEWRQVPPLLSNAIARGRWAAFGLQDVHAESALKLLHTVDVEQLDCSDLLPDERKTVLRELDDVAILKRLPIHEDLDGALVSIGDNTFLEDGIVLDRPSFPGVTVIARQRDVSVLERQRRFIGPLDAGAAIELVLKQEQPSRHWRLLFDAVTRLARDTQPLDQSWREALQRSNWLPLEGGNVAAPENVMHLPGLQDEVARVISQTGGALIDVLGLSADVRKHPRFDLVASALFPGPADALAMLGAVMGDREQCCIGDLDPTAVDLPAFLDAFRDAPPPLMECLPLLDGVARTLSPAECASSLLPALARPIPIQRLIDILRFLSATHGGGAKRDTLLTVYHLYLALAAKLPPGERRQVLVSVPLLSRAGHWKAATALCADAEGVDSNALLHEEQRRILGLVGRARGEDDAIAHAGGAPSRSMRSQADWDDVFKRSADQLRDYFLPWQGIVAPEVIGGFLVLLGDQSELKTLAQRYLGKRSAETTRAALAWDTFGHHPMVETMVRQRFDVRVHEEEQLTVPDLVGGTFRARLSKTVDSLLLGDPWRGQAVTPEGQPVNALTLRRIDPASYTPEKLSDLLLASAVLVLRAVYYQRHTNLREIWQDLAESEQLDIQVAQSFLLEDAPYYLRRLQANAHGGIAAALRAWDAARHLEKEEEHAERLGRTSRERHAAAQRAEAADTLKSLLSGDPSVQGTIVAALRRLMREHYQYTATSVPFELFQNADDAVVELEEMLPRGERLPEPASRFVVDVGAERLVFMHWGRRINQFGSHPFDGREKGFDRDLEKMLILSSSDKNPTDASTRSVTGKFGLGFKSVFIVTDAPSIASGRLFFRVVGGFLPERLAGDDAHDLLARCERLGLPERDVTLFDLPLRDPGAMPGDDALREFWALAHILVAFSRRIKRIDIFRDGIATQHVSWTAEEAPGVPGVFTAPVRPLVATSEGSSGRALMFRCQDGALLFTLGAREVKSLPAEVPTVWVTAPTKERADLGFAVNGAFAVDIGRAQLARESEANRSLASALGLQLGSVLGELARRTVTAWQDVRAALHLAQDADAFRFWDSLWEILGVTMQKKRDVASGQEVYELFARLLWDHRDGAAASCFSTHAVLPTGLAGAHRTLTRLRDVQWVATGSLEADDAFALASAWHSFGVRIAPGSIVSDRHVIQPLRRLCRDLVPAALRSISLPDVLEWELGTACELDPDAAQRIGGIVTPEFLVQLLQGTEAQQKEHARIEEHLAKARFRARDGSFRPGRELLTAAHEAEVASFAPHDSVLADEYADDALRLFESCRGGTLGWELPIADWVLDADDAQRQRAALRYLASGRPDGSVYWEVQRRLAGGWLECLPSSPVLQELDADREDVLLRQLGFTRPAPPRPRVDFPVVLDQIYEWWASEGQTYTSRYDARLYSDGRPPQVDRDALLALSDPVLREEWLLLFMYGMVHTLGRAQAGQHREFLRQFRQRGWLTTFADLHSSAEQRLNVVEEYLADQTQSMTYYYWMGQFVGIYQVARWLSEYVNAFLQIDHVQSGFSLDAILAPRASSFLQGSGLDAPPLTRVLGIGACYVVRELCRTGVLRNPHAYEHCYTPTGAVRSLLRSLGCTGLADDNPGWHQSRLIHAFLLDHLGEQRALFGLTFDLPFLTIAHDPDLQRQFLGYELTDFDD